MTAVSTDVRPIDWDAWRAGYDQMSFADQREFYRRVAELHPFQASFRPAQITRAFDCIGGRDLRVCELGGWDGRLAERMLARPDVASWTNFDLAAVPQACGRAGYLRVVLEDYLWNGPPVDADILVATHTIEHLRARELALLFDWTAARWIYLESPIVSDATDFRWDGFEGSHVLEIGWAQILAMLGRRGYKGAVMQERDADGVQERGFGLWELA